MKPVLLVVLALSLAGNVVLSVLVSRQPAGISESIRIAPGAKDATSANRAATAATARQPAESSPAADSMQWPMVASTGDLPALVARLRAAGVPTSVIRAIVQQEINTLFQSRRTDATGPYWKMRNTGNPERVAAQQALDREQRTLMESLLGADARASRSMDPWMRERRYGALSDEKVDAIDAINRDYAELQNKAASQRGQDGQNRDAAKQFQFLRDEQRKDVAAVLTPEELEQYDLRNSPAALQVMSNLRNIDTTEAEYVALYRSQQAFEATNPSGVGMLTPDAMERRQAAQDQVNENAHAVLGDDRYYEYLKTADFRYNMVATFTAKYPSVSPAATYQLYQLDRSTQTAVGRISSTVPPEQRQAEMANLGAAYDAKVLALLGPDVAAAYSNLGSGRMFRRPARNPVNAVPAVQLPGGG